MFTRKILTFCLDAELRNYNAGQGRHWGMTHAEKRRLQNAVETCVIVCDDKIIPLCEVNSPRSTLRGLFPMDRTIDITVTRVLGKGQRFWDQDSVLRGNAKQLIDSLVDAKMLQDDSVKWVGRCLGLQDAERRRVGPKIEIDFWEHDE